MIQWVQVFIHLIIALAGVSHMKQRTLTKTRWVFVDIPSLISMFSSYNCLQTYQGIAMLLVYLLHTRFLSPMALNFVILRKEIRSRIRSKDNLITFSPLMLTKIGHICILELSNSGSPSILIFSEIFEWSFKSVEILSKLFDSPSYQNFPVPISDITLLCHDGVNSTM